MSFLIHTQKRFIQKQSRSLLDRLFNRTKAKKATYGAYTHVVQVGDPVLRMTAKEIPKHEILGSNIQAVIQLMKNVMDKYGAVGLSAPQIGLPLRIVCVQMTDKEYKYWNEDDIRERGIEVFGRKVFINPSLKIASNEVEAFREGCCSINGFSAVVPRYKEVHVKGYDENGNEVNWTAKNWAARIVQHELDHIDGKLYVDKMVSESFAYNYWAEVNHKHGEFVLPFSGFKSTRKWKQYFFPFLLLKQPKF